MNRQATLDAVRANPDIPVLIVGAGINGAGLLRELALQGIDALLVDKGDICAGTSAGSTRIIHGGLRYLENGEFRLVREALGERNQMLQTAPHYVRPLQVTIPIYDYFSGMIHAARKFFGMPSKPGDRGALVIKVGLTLYDVLTNQAKTMPNHMFRSKAETLKIHPHLNPNITTTAIYYDGRVSHPEHMTYELVEDAEALHPGARGVNYVRVAAADGDTVTLVDELSGEELTVKPKIVVNATGAWIDFTNRALNRETKFIGGTKGSHLILDHPELAEEMGDRMFYFANTDGRVPIFYNYYGRVLTGTTDIPIDDPEDAICTDEEIDYIFDAMKLVFPTIEIDRSHIVFTFSGVRPLPSSDAVTTGQISRDHENRITPPGDGINFPIYSLIGGKWTSYRAFSEQVADTILAEFGKQRQGDSLELAVGGGKDYPQTDVERQRWLSALWEATQVELNRLSVLFDRYGTRARQVAEYIAAGDDAPLDNHPMYSRREIAFLTECEMSMRVDDIILRRTLIGMLGEFNQALLEEIAAIMAGVHGWSADETQAEVQRVVTLLAERHLVDPESLAERTFNPQSDVRHDRA